MKNIRIKYAIIICILVFIASIGASYAYFAYQVEKTSVIAGNIVSINADLKVELEVGTNDEMVPLQDEALSNAINGVGSPNGACIDSMNNLSCQVYKITLTNNGSRLKNLKGTVELYAKNGTGNAYQNLKWRELTNQTTVKDGTVINGMEKSDLVTGLAVESKSTLTWYIAVWISNINMDQTNTDKGQFEGKVTFERDSVIRTEFIEKTLKENAALDNIASEYVTSSSGIDFTTISSDTNGKGIYLKSGTENDTYPIYYYRGEVDNNLIFAGFCWKIVRTTETGGMKLIYNGVPNGNSCDNTGEATIISTKAFNQQSNSPAYVGYMYGTPYQIQYLDNIPSSFTMTVGNSVTYSNGQYTLVNTKTDTWANLYNGGFDNYHYTCGTTEAKCDIGVGYVYLTDEFSGYLLVLTDGKTIETALEEMLDYNTNGSTIKGNQSTVGTLDWWYATNIEPNYSNYIEDTVWCYDRSIYSLGGFDSDGGPTYIGNLLEISSTLIFNSFKNNSLDENPSLSCSRDIDRFTVNSGNGNGDLDYPVGLLTDDEVILAGGNYNYEINNTYYLYSGRSIWVDGSAWLFGNVNSTFLTHDGYLDDDNATIYQEFGVRPSISLKPGFTIVEGGTGTASNPYVVS